MALVLARFLGKLFLGQDTRTYLNIPRYRVVDKTGLNAQYWLGLESPSCKES